MLLKIQIKYDIIRFADAVRLHRGWALQPYVDAGVYHHPCTAAFFYIIFLWELVTVTVHSLSLSIQIKKADRVNRHGRLETKMNIS